MLWPLAVSVPVVAVALPLALPATTGSLSASVMTIPGMVDCFLVFFLFCSLAHSRGTRAVGELSFLCRCVLQFFLSRSLDVLLPCFWRCSALLLCDEWCLCLMGECGVCHSHGTRIFSLLWGSFGRDSKSDRQNCPLNRHTLDPNY